MKSKIFLSFVILCTSVLFILLIIMIVGIHGNGPFQELYWTSEEKRVVRQNPYKDYQNGIVFYGDSNFRLWKEMKDDLKDYDVANCGFGGSYDSLLLEKADVLLYPYNPSIVFLQTSSNDYLSMSGLKADMADSFMEKKINMYTEFHNNLPNTQFFIMAAILMPGRTQYEEIVLEVNKKIKEYCKTVDYLTYVDSESMFYHDGVYEKQYFIKDKIHLTHEARLIWARDYIIPAIENYKNDLN